jgi:hypothetical protein
MAQPLAATIVKAPSSGQLGEVPETETLAASGADQARCEVGD